MNRERWQSLLYLLLDFLASYVVWLAFVELRRQLIEHRDIPFENQQFINAAVISTFWCIVYAFAGLYAKPFHKSRLQELTQVLKATFTGVLVIFFSVILDDYTPNYQNYRMTVTSFFGLQFFSVALVRFIITTRTQLRIRHRKLGFPTLIVGCGPQAYAIYKELAHMRRPLGYMFKGFVSLPESRENRFLGKLKHLGRLEDLRRVIISRDISEVIIALEKDESQRIAEVVEICEQTNSTIKVAPGVYDYLMGSVKVNHIMGTPLIEVFPQIMKPWEVVAKRLFDVCFALIALTLLVPIYLVLAVLIRLDSSGPVFYRQERIGKGGRPFMIIKFRSMRTDAEQGGPALSSKTDSRITRVGRFMRKTRLDELPQFWNVLIGEMSVVGPRPERAYFIEQIAKVAPHCRHLQKVKPGVTSWGQVKFGYAENVEEMVRRLQFDILYLENMSLALDLRIILYTVIVMIEGRGK